MVKKYKMITVKFDKSNYESTPEIIKWCESNLTKNKWTYTDFSLESGKSGTVYLHDGTINFGYIRVMFELDTDHTLFKLTWMLN